MGKFWIFLGIVFTGNFLLEKFNDHMNNVVLTSSNEQLQKLHRYVMCEDKPELTYFESLTATKAGWALRERGRYDLAREVSNSCYRTSN